MGAGTGWGIGAGTVSGVGDGIGWGIGAGTVSGAGLGMGCGTSSGSEPGDGLGTRGSGMEIELGLIMRFQLNLTTLPR